MKFVVDIEQTRGLKARRIKGFIDLIKTRLRTPYPIKIIKHKYFLKYKKTKSFDENFKKELDKALKELKAKNPRKNIIGRCGLWVPGMENIPAPRSTMIFRNSQALDFLKSVYEIALKHRLDKKGSEICVIFHPFICPQIDEPAGQCFSSYDKEGKFVLIESIFGNDEAVQSLPHDIFLVDWKNKQIMFKEIAVKKKTLSAISGKWKIVKLPKKIAEKATLDDKEVLEIAKEAKKIEKRKGPAVLEFLYMYGKRYYTDFRSYKPRGKYTDFLKKIEVSEKISKPIKGKILKIKNEKDLKKLRARKNQILFLDRDVVIKRNLKLILKLAEMTKKTASQEIVIYPGRHTTAHYILALKEAGNILVFTPAMEFKTGDEVIITNESVTKVN